ncbi:MAG: SDR family NAD(P)-dependent oxidoreductase [Parvibaculum sp.]|uniref:SDR family NAD(P)-dependent oxidoreductase n=1 Tax=Parvibaculum sp. TaxID=2024848 RepID=UPI0027158091|nr:SDR family NAD(P)-dependent oxidoreductase [Parvibaculum sp.]MDO8837364.1 SDR family NAD(P)-dependent oxidoreductase [Parvibaculum sp.]
MKHVMVTGGVGSVGRAVVERLLATCPEVERIVIYSRDEHKQGDLAQELAAHAGKLDFIIGDVKDRDHLRRSLRGVDTVVHTAAMRLVPHAEANPEECLRTNVEGAMSLAAAVSDSKVRKVVGISSDKAVAPTTIYGASKFAMERVFLNADRITDTRFSLVRYANILNSRSSVAPLFLKQRDTGVLTITDPQMSRFSITMREGVDLILFALEYGWGGELICPIAPSYRVRDMATAIAPDAEHRVIGARPGEKLHEAMFSMTEAPFVVRREGYYIVTPTRGRWKLTDYCADIPEARPLETLFEYDSGSNDDWLSVEDIRALVCRVFGLNRSLDSQ